jgi:hypothetical protein
MPTNQAAAAAKIRSINTGLCSQSEGLFLLNSNTSRGLSHPSQHHPRPPRSKSRHHRSIPGAQFGQRTAPHCTPAPGAIFRSPLRTQTHSSNKILAQAAPTQKPLNRRFRGEVYGRRHGRLRPAALIFPSHPILKGIQEWASSSKLRNNQSKNRGILNRSCTRM